MMVSKPIQRDLAEAATAVPSVLAAVVAGELEATSPRDVAMVRRLGSCTSAVAMFLNEGRGFESRRPLQKNPGQGRCGGSIGPSKGATGRPAPHFPVSLTVSLTPSFFDTKFLWPGPLALTFCV